MRPVHLAHARVVGDQHAAGAGVQLRHPLGNGGEIGYGDHAKPGTERQPLGNTGREAHAGESTGPAAKGDGIERGQADAAFGQNGVHHGKKLLGVTAFELDIAIDGAITNAE